MKQHAWPLNLPVFFVVEPSNLLSSLFQYLNTVIPFEKKGTPPSVDDLQMLTKSMYKDQGACMKVISL